jgi:hypothetical protein
MSMKLILITVDTDKDPNWLADALSAEVVLKLRPFVPGETAELLKLKAEGVSVIDLGDLMGDLRQ